MRMHRLIRIYAKNLTGASTTVSSMARTLMAHLPCLTRTHSWAPMVPYMRPLCSNFCIKCYVFMLLFSFSVFSDGLSLKIENENNNTKTLTAEVSNMAIESLEFGSYRN